MCKEEFSANLKFYRTERHLTQQDLAAALDMSQQSISQWEKGQTGPTLSALIKLADFFDVTLDELCGRA